MPLVNDFLAGAAIEPPRLRVGVSGQQLSVLLAGHSV
jgi:hypothetical protein